MVFNPAHTAAFYALAVRYRPREKWPSACLLLLLTLLPVKGFAVAVQEYKEKNILVLYSHEQELSTYVELDRALRSELRSSSEYSVVFYTEYLDLLRFHEARHQQKLVDYLRVKYSDRKIDLVIPVSPLAFQFFMDHGDKLFPGVPAVFTSIGVARLKNLTLKPNITGVAVTRDVRDTLDFALHIQPDTVGVVVPAGSSPVERSWTEEMRTTFSAYPGHVSITMLPELPMSELLRRLNALPPHTVVLFSSSYFYDSAGNYFLPEEVLDLISHASNSPVYSINEPYLGHGIVGGYLFSMAEPGQAAGKMGKRVLNGEKVEDIPVQTINPNHFMVDARQLKHWGIDEKKLPPGTIVRFNQQSGWDLYKWYVLAAMVLVVVQFVLIFSLVSQDRRVKRSQTMLRELSRHLITVQEEERKRIARELHDDFGQRVALIKIELEMLAQKEECAWKADLKETLPRLISHVNELATDIQDLSHTLHSSKLQYVGLSGAVKDLCHQVSKQHLVEVELICKDLGEPVSDDIALCFYRVAQEALHNSAKHSGARRVVVKLSRDQSLLHMTITDDGKGFDQTRPSFGLGLASMRERLQMVGGQVVIRSKPGRGTTLAVQAPLLQPLPQSKVS